MYTHMHLEVTGQTTGSVIRLNFCHVGQANWSVTSQNPLSSAFC